ADVTPHMVLAAGLGIRVQGMKRYYALLLSKEGAVSLVKALDGDHILTSKPYAWKFGQTYQLELEANENNLTAWIDGQIIFEFQDTDHPLLGGAVALICSEGRTTTQSVTVKPAYKDKKVN
ncbi:MAG: ADP-ribosylglycohydrolase family protein, partial [Anaerolineae bacterium]|nr:ADP-ribosylglycohydrolase family protein [Anaerolineae bacterium]